jgi:hypothetical protein
MKLRPPSPAPKKNPAALASKGGVFAGLKPTSYFNAKPLCKKWRVLQAFMNGSRWDRFTAFELHDTCLHSTISTLRHSHGLKFIDRSIPKVTRHGHRTHVTQYWLDPDAANIALATALLGGV